MAPSLVRLAAVAFAAALTVTASACTASPDVSDEDTDVAEGQLVSFVCDRAEITKNNPNAPFAQVVDVRAAGHDGFDRFVMQFAAGQVPSYHVSRQRGATFFQDGSGMPITVPGSAGLNIGVQPASGFNFDTGTPSFAGPNRFRPTGARLMTEAVSTGDFEAHVGWGVGLQRAACYRVFELANPPRLVVDVQR